MHFYRKVSSGKTGLPFQSPTYSREFFGGTHGKRVSQNPEFLHWKRNVDWISSELSRTWTWTFHAITSITAIFELSLLSDHSYHLKAQTINSSVKIYSRWYNTTFNFRYVFKMSFKCQVKCQVSSNATIKWESFLCWEKRTCVFSTFTCTLISAFFTAWGEVSTHFSSIH